MDFLSRKLVIEKHFPNAVVLPQYDNQSDHAWSQLIVSAVHNMFPDHEEATMFGGRDSCLPHFHGSFKKEFVMDVDLGSGTALREEAAKIPLESEDFRRGCIYTTYRTRPAPIMAVDIALLRDQGQDGVVGGPYLLLGRKPGEELWRFPGGKVDITDQSLEACGRRELQEEAGIFPEHMEYVKSYLVNDWRYAKNPDQKIMTTLYVARELVKQEAIAGDDLKEVKWFQLDQVSEETVVTAHRPLVKDLLAHLKGKK